MVIPMNKPLFLFVGKSASGKTTIADILEKNYGYKQVSSYTTRLPRYDGEIGHVFVTDDEFDNIAVEDIVAYTEYNGYRYGTTAEQLDKCSVYVVDVPGVETLLQNYKSNRRISIIYFDTTVFTRINRMLDRGDSDVRIISRLLEDEKSDWYKQLDSLAWRYSHILNRHVELHSVNANGNETSVLEMILFYMNRDQED